MWLHSGLGADLGLELGSVLCPELKLLEHVFQSVQVMIIHVVEGNLSFHHVIKGYRGDIYQSVSMLTIQVIRMQGLSKACFRFSDLAAFSSYKMLNKLTN